MADIKVKDLSETQTVSADNEIMVLTDENSNLVQNITVENFLSNIISSDGNNALTVGDDKKLYSSDITGEIGNLDNLITYNKNNIVSAINEVKGDSNAIINEALSASKGWLESDKLYQKSYWYGEKIYNDVLYYAHSSFDVSKFTITGSPTINDGIASGFSSSNKVKVPYTFQSPNSFTIKGSFTFPSTIDTSVKHIVLGIARSGSDTFFLEYRAISDNVGVLIYSNGASSHGSLEYSLINELPAIPDKTYNYTITVSGTSITLNVDGITKSANNFYTATSTNYYVGCDRNGSNNFPGSLDLKQYSVTVGGAEVFSGNKTGTDTYTIGGSTVTIPYTLSKTGSKIVDSTYRTQVSSVYSELGYAPYYTIDEENENVSLPMGEIYGFIEQKQNSIDNVFEKIVPVYNDNLRIEIGFSAYTTPDNGYIYCPQLNSSASLLLYIQTNISGAVNMVNCSGGTNCSFCLPVPKGARITVTTVDTNLHIYFMPAQG